jgi:hypothetical protein
VQAGNQGEVLLRVADRICEELGYVEVGEVPGAHSGLGQGLGMSYVLNSEDEELVTSLRKALAKITAALHAEGPGEPRGPGIQAALGGAETVARGELLSGNAEKLPQLMPSFVFLVALPIVAQDRALELSRLTSQLIDEELRG